MIVLRSSLKRGRVLFVATTFAAIVVLTMGTTAPADADGSLGGLTLTAATVDPQTGDGHVSVSVTCLNPASFIRTRFITRQSSGAGGRDAVSLDVGAAFGCAAGETVTMRVPLGGQQGRFHPGPATFDGFVYADETLGGTTIGFVTFNRTLLLHPE